jgi:hypothetical protein
VSPRPVNVGVDRGHQKSNRRLPGPSRLRLHSEPVHFTPLRYTSLCHHALLTTTTPISREDDNTNIALTRPR